MPLKRNIGRDEEKDGQVEQIDVGDDGREEHAHRAEGEPPQEGERQEEQPLGVADQTEEADHGHHDRRGDHGLGRPPDDLAR